MKRLLWALAAVVVLCVLVGTSSAWAANAWRYCSSYNGPSATRCQPGGVGSGWEPGFAEAANNLAAWAKAAGGSCGNGTKPDVTVDSATESGGVLRFHPCPGGSAFTQNFGTAKEAAPITCELGKEETKQVRMGYSRALARADGARWRTSDGREFYAPTGPLPEDTPAEYCDGICRWVADGPSTEWYVSNDAGPTGMHDIYKGQKYMNTGDQCSAAKDPRMDPATAPPACDGFVGQVNGKTVCAAKGAPSTAANKPKITDSPAGSTPSTTTDTGTGKPKELGPNGEKPGKPSDKPGITDLGGTGNPISGEPSSSTPSEGTSTSVSSDGKTTTTTFRIDIKSCGGAGQPACKIDESGTSGTATMTLDFEGMTSTETTRRGTVSGTGDKGWFDAGWKDLFQAPPLVACQPIAMPSVMGMQVPEMNACAVINGGREVMAFIWAFLGLFACIAMIREVI